MSYNVRLSDNFKREAKRLIKKYRSLKVELAELMEELEENPKQGILITTDIYKIRMAVKSKGRGKSGGVRILTFINEDKQKILLFSIFDKSEKDNLSQKQIADLVKDFKWEDDEDNKSEEE